MWSINESVFKANKGSTFCIFVLFLVAYLKYHLVILMYISALYVYTKTIHWISFPWCMTLYCLQGFVPEQYISLNESGKADCYFCGKQFIQKSDAKRHIIAVHSGLQQHVKCSYCDKVMKNKQSLGSHLRSEHGVYKQKLN